MEECDYTQTAVVVTKVSLCANCTLNAYFAQYSFIPIPPSPYGHYIAQFRYDFTTLLLPPVSRYKKRDTVFFFILYPFVPTYPMAMLLLYSATISWCCDYNLFAAINSEIRQSPLWYPFFPSPLSL